MDSVDNSTDEIPTLSTFVDIISDSIGTWSSCASKVYGAPSGIVELQFCISMLLAAFYFYVISVIVWRRITQGQFKSSFYNCVILLAVGDIGTIIITARATIPVCALLTSPARYLAFESLTVFCVDFIYGVNFVMSMTRMNAIINYSSTETKRKVEYFFNGFLVLEFIWALSMGVLYFKGYIKRIWFTGTSYHSEFLFPFNYFRTEFNMAELGLTFLIYCLAFVKFRRVSTSTKSLPQQSRLLFMAVLIFMCELLFIYSSDWLGYTWGIGDGLFNANVAYFGKPISTGMTPFFYILFSSEVRNACLFCSKSKRNVSKFLPCGDEIRSRGSSSPSLRTIVLIFRRRPGFHAVAFTEVLIVIIHVIETGWNIGSPAIQIEDWEL